MIEITNILNLEKHIQNVEAVVFDLDDTLYSEKEYVKSGFHEIASHFSQIEGLEAELAEAFGKNKKAIDYVFDRHAISSDIPEAIRIYREQTPDITPYSGVPEMLARIKAKKKTGIITDGRPDGQRKKLRSLGIELLFDEIIITDELGGIAFRKPNELAFKMIQTHFGIPFSKICYVGDNIEKDFIAPNALGMQSVWFNNSGGLYAKKTK